MGSLVARFIKDDRGQDLLEYAMVSGLIAIGAVAALTTIGDDVAKVFDKIKIEMAKVAAS
jgi:pilus assembly protein Flp/PilA